MQVDLQQPAPTSYDSMAKWYAWFADPFEKKLSRLGVDLLAPAVGEKILEVGCGTGQTLLEVARRVGDSGKVFGLDASSKMLEIAEKRSRKAGFSNRIELDCRSAHALPYPPSSMDGAIMCFTLETFPDAEIPDILESIKTVLKPGGRLCVVAISARPSHSLSYKLYRWSEKKFPQWVDCHPIDLSHFMPAAGLRLREVRNHSLYGIPVDLALGVR